MERLDVVIVGAGLAGVAAAVRLRRGHPERRIAVLEGRERSGGTWDLFRFPGVRSDSDMFTLGYPFRPWAGGRALADGASILAYLRDTAREEGVEPLVRYRHRVERASWSSSDACWTLDVATASGPVRLRCGFLFLCTGYYRYDRGHTPEFPGRERYAGRIVHPQAWPEDLVWAGRRVVVVGSGATAVTLVPALARDAAHVTMVQRSPSHVVSVSSEDGFVRGLRRVLPRGWADAVARWQRIAQGWALYTWCRRRPEQARRWIRRGVRRQLGGTLDVDVHFAPRYDPWRQRLCLALDGDLFRALREGRASVRTDPVVGFTERGVRLASGEEVAADLVVTATGLEVELWGGVDVRVDGVRVEPGGILLYLGAMAEGVPNLAMALGYTNAAWTLKVDLTARYVGRLLAHMGARGHVRCTPRRRDPSMRTEPAIDLASGYVVRARDRLPRQGLRPPWRLHGDYLRDSWLLCVRGVDDGVMEFAGPRGGA